MSFKKVGRLKVECEKNLSIIRLRYAGIIVFASRLLSILTGLAFVLMITRSISAEEFGVWGNINDVLAYFTLPALIVPFGLHASWRGVTLGQPRQA